MHKSVRLKTILLVLSFLLGKGFLIAQSLKEKELKTEIKEVTVFFKGAQIFETGTVAIPAGKTKLLIKNLSPFLDEKSMQVKALGAFTILAVNHKLNHLQKLKKDARLDSLSERLDMIELSISKENARAEVLREKMSLLNENKKMTPPQTGSGMAQLKQAIDFFEGEITAIKEEELKIKKSIGVKRDEQAALQQQMKEMNNLPVLPVSEVEITVQAEANVNGTFQLTYLVGNAGWYPKYDVRVENIRSPLELTCKAEVYQNTGADWKNVKLRFSNGDPNKSGVVPELLPWNLNYARNTVIEKSIYGLTGLSGNVKGIVTDESGVPLSGASVMVKGSAVGTVTDGSGRYSITLPNKATQLIFSYVGKTTQEVAISRPEINVRLSADKAALSEVVVVGYGTTSGSYERNEYRTEKVKSEIITTSIVENQTTVEIEVEAPYSIASNGEKLLVDLKRLNMEALYQYYAIPKMDKDGFLVAKIMDWDKFNLLEGEANLYFEDAYVGRTILDARALEDTLTISLGRDNSMVIAREKVETFTKTRTIGTNSVETRGFKITLRNKKSQPVTITLFDQIPVSVVSDITVNAIELSKGQLDAATGKVTWEITLEPLQQKEILLQYEVKYPRRERVILE